MCLRRIVSFILTLLLLFQAMPVGAVAESFWIDPPSSEEIQAWVEKSGTAEGAPGYIEGMDLSASMNAAQMAGWISDYRDSRLLGVMECYEDIDAEIGDQEAAWTTAFDENYDQLTELEIEVTGTLDLLNDCISRIDAYAVLMKDETMDEDEREEFTFLLGEAGEEMDLLMRNVLEQAPQWQTETNRLEQAMLDLSGDLPVSNPVVAEAEVPISSTSGENTVTRLSRLLPVSSALADTSKTMKIRVIDDKSFVMAVSDDGKPLAGAKVTVKSQRSNAEKTANTGEAGDAVFQVRDFNPDKDGEVALTAIVSRDGYRKRSLPGIYVRKGNSYKVLLEKDDGTPYIYEWAYEGHDILNNDYEIITSPLNDKDKTIRLKVDSRNAYTLNVWYENKGKEKKYLAKDVKGQGDKTYSFTGKFSCDLLGEAKIYAEITGEDGKKITRTSRLKVERAVIDQPISFNEKSSIFDHTLSFNFPNSFPQPLKGSKISVEIPFAKLWPIDININLDGSGYFYLGAQDTSDAKWDTSKWQSKDKKEIAKMVKDAEKQGYFKQQRLKSGNDEAYKRRRFLAGVDVDICAIFFAKLKYIKGEGDKGLLKLAGGAAFAANVSAEIKMLYWGWFYFGISFNLKAIAGPQVNLDIYTRWPKGQLLPSIEKVKFSDSPFSFNLTMRLEIGVFVGAGVKGYVSVTLTGYGFITLTMNFRTFKKNSITVHAGFGARVVAQFFTAKWVKQLGDELKWRLLPPPVEPVKSSTNLLDRLIAFIGLSRAEAAPEQNSSEDETVSVNLWNPNQIVNALPAGGSDPFSGNNSAYIRVKIPGTNQYCERLFCLKMNRDNRSTLFWNDPSGNCLQNIREVLPPDNEVRKILNQRDVIDYSLQVAGPGSWASITSDGKPVSEMLLITMLLSDGYTEEEYTYPADDGETLAMGKRKVPKETDYCIVLGLIPQGSANGIRLVFTDLVIRSNAPVENPGTVTAKPICKAFSLGSGRNLRSPATEHTLMFLGYYLRVMFTPAEQDPIKNQIMICGNFLYNGKENTSYRPAETLLPVATEEKELENDGFCSIVPARMIIPNGNDAFQTNVPENWYGISVKNEGKRRLMVHTKKRVKGYGGGYTTGPNRGLLQVSEDQDDVLQYVYVKGSFEGETLPTHTVHDVLFYLVPEGSNGQARLKQAVVTLQNKNGTTEANKSPKVSAITVYDMDMNFPDAVLHYDRVLGNDLLWWIETTSENGREKSEKSYWKIRGIWLSRDTSGAFTVSPSFTMAMIEVQDKKKLPESILFVDEETNSKNRRCYGYYVLTQEGNDSGTLQRFEYKQTVGLDIYGATLADTIAAAGSRDEMTISVANNGSVNVCAAEFGIYEKKSGGESKKIETIYADFREESKSTLTVEEGKTSLSGNSAVRKISNVLWNKEDKTRLLKGTKREYDSQSGKETKTSVSGLFRLPGIPASTGASFASHLYIPKSWSTALYNVEIRVEKIFVQANETLTPIPVRRLGAGSPNQRSLPDLLASSARKKGDSSGSEEESGLLGFVMDGGSVKIMSDSADVTETYGDQFSTDVFFDAFEMDTDEHDLQLDYDCWSDDGTEMVTLYIREMAYRNPQENVWLKAWRDDETKPSFSMRLNGLIPDQAITDGLIWNLDIPLEELTGHQKPNRLRIAISGDEDSEIGDADNEMEIPFDTEEFLIIEQPLDVTVPELEDASFRVAVKGGREPYVYQWQVKSPKGDWADAEDGMNPELNLKSVPLTMDGNLYRCVICDDNDVMLTTREALLTVIKIIPVTGDSAAVAEWIILVLLGVGILLCLGVTGRKGRRNRP